MSAYLMLLLILVIGYISKNNTVTYATAILLGLKIILPTKMLEYVNTHGVNWGIIVLTVGMFAPIALGQIEPRNIVESFKSLTGVISVVVGIIVALLGSWGVTSLKNDPAMVVALMVGTIVGVAFFKGLPMGPVIASGIVYAVLKFIHLFI